MKTAVLSPLAQSDLDDIWSHSVSEWGVRRTSNYVVAIRDAIAQLADTPLIAKDCGDIKPGHRKYGVGSHVVFFKVTPDGIDIVRILHQRMDAGRHLV
ncbi:MAG: hypothetical protein DCF30_16430 [Hyphomicrobiales bacterium]|nr:MAG: hypothetical protein DCF30_16430 [Hyphomicrobiales bacterium]